MEREAERERERGERETFRNMLHECYLCLISTS